MSSPSGTSGRGRASVSTGRRAQPDERLVTVGPGTDRLGRVGPAAAGQRRPTAEPWTSQPDPPLTDGHLMHPTAQGLYDPRFEHDACGVAFVADMHGRRSHRMVEMGLDSLCNLDHRGATNAEPNVGDGAGILLQVPDRFLREVVDFELPPAGAYAVGMAFLPRDPEQEAAAMTGIEKIAATEGLQVLGWREVPIDNAMIGQQAADAEPSFRQRVPRLGGRAPAAHRHRPRPALLRGAQADRARARDRRRSRVLPEPVGPHPRLQGDAHLRPGRPVLHRPHATSGSSRPSPWCTAASRPTRSRRGRWPTRTGSSPTTARSTP